MLVRLYPLKMLVKSKGSYDVTVILKNRIKFKEQKISNEVEIISPIHTVKNKNFELNWEKILDKAHDVTIISECASSSDISFHQEFSTSLLTCITWKE